jgi:diguanylate cyclase (GGDEF)-like protein
MQKALHPCTAAAQPGDPPHPFRRARRLILVGWLLIASAALVLSIWQAVSSGKRAFEHTAREVADSITGRALVAETALEAFAAFVTSQSPFDHATTAEFARALLTRYPFLYKFEVAQQVTHAERAVLEERMWAVYPGFEVQQFDYADTRQWRTAPIASTYFPIIFQEPYFSDERQIVGLDLNSSLFLIDAMQASSRLGLPMATRPFMLAENVSGYVIHRALGHGPGTPAAPLTATRYALLALRTDLFIGDLTGEHQALAITVGHVDESQAPDESVRLVQTQGRDSTTIERLLLPSFRQSFSLTGPVPSQPFEVELAWQMHWRDLNLPLLLGLILGIALLPSLARRFALAYFEHRLARLDSDGELYQMANFDALTGVANRHRLIDQLGITLLRAARDKTQFCLLFMDIDGFKGINDRLGHAAGDAVLVAFCEHLGDLLRGDEMLGRLGGDEFVIITGDNTGPVDIASLIARIKAQTRQPLLYRKQPVHIDFSVGHACYPADGRSIAALLDVADRRMYREKQHRREKIAVSV